jgi:hypothetical protein
MFFVGEKTPVAAQSIDERGFLYYTRGIREDGFVSRALEAIVI